MLTTFNSSVEFISVFIYNRALVAVVLCGRYTIGYSLRMPCNYTRHRIVNITTISHYVRAQRLCQFLPLSEKNE